MFLAFNSNLVKNGNGESGPCANGNNIRSPPSWNCNGSITQVKYSANFLGHLSSSDDGPS